MFFQELIERIEYLHNVMRVWSSWPLINVQGRIEPIGNLEHFWQAVEDQTRLRNNVSIETATMREELCLNYEWDEGDFEDSLQLSFKQCLNNIIRSILFGTDIESQHSISSQMGLVENNRNAMFDEIRAMFRENRNLDISVSNLVGFLQNEPNQVNL